MRAGFLKGPFAWIGVRRGAAARGWKGRPPLFFTAWPCCSHCSPLFGPRARWPGGEPPLGAGTLEFLLCPAHRVHTWAGGGPLYKSPFGGP